MRWDAAGGPGESSRQGEGSAKALGWPYPACSPPAPGPGLKQGLRAEARLCWGPTSPPGLCVVCPGCALCLSGSWGGDGRTGEHHRLQVQLRKPCLAARSLCGLCTSAFFSWPTDGPHTVFLDSVRVRADMNRYRAQVQARRQAEEALSGALGAGRTLLRTMVLAVTSAQPGVTSWPPPARETNTQRDATGQRALPRPVPAATAQSLNQATGRKLPPTPSIALATLASQEFPRQQITMVLQQGCTLCPATAKAQVGTPG